MTNPVEQLGLTGKFFPEKIPGIFKMHGLAPKKVWAVFELNYLDATMSVEAERKKPALLPGNTVSGRYKSNSPRQWLTFDDAMTESLRLREEALEQGYEGRTFMPCYVVQMNEFFVDLDNHEEDEGVEKNHRQMIETFGMAYAEYSMSGAGQHIYIPQGWTLEGSVHKVVGEINIQMKKSGEFLLMTGNVVNDLTTTPTLQPPQFVEVLERYFREAATPTAAFDVEFEEWDDNGEEGDDDIVSAMSEDSKWQLNNPLGQMNPHLANGGSDGSTQLSRVVMDIMRMCRNREACLRILQKSVMWQYENRKMESHGKDTPKQYDRWRMVCANSALKELLRRGFGKVVTFELNIQKELGMEEPADINSHVFNREIGQPAKAFFETAPDNFKWFVNELMKSVDNASQIYDYAIGSALSILSAFAGRKFVAPVGIHRNFLCTNILLVGDSGIGKSNYTSLQRRIQMQAPKESILRAFGFTQPKASKALVKALNNASIPGNTFFYPEFGKQLANTFRTSNNNPDDLSATLMASSTERKYGAVLTGVSRANAENDIAEVMHPCYSILGDTTVDLLKEHASSTDFNSGFLARFLIVPNNELTLEVLYDVNPFETSEVVKISPDVIHMLEAIAKPWAMFSTNEGGVPEPFAIVPEDRNFAWGIHKQIAALRIKYQHHKIKAPFFNRMGEYVYTIAALTELCKLEAEPKLTNQSLDWAFKYVTRCITSWCEQLDEQISTARTSEDVVEGLLRVFYKVLSAADRGGWKEVARLYPQAVRSKTLTEHHLNNGGLPKQFFKQQAKFIKQEGNFSGAARVIDEHLTILIEREYLMFEECKNPKGKPTLLFKLTDLGLQYGKELCG